uniref:GST C-terminal domain-containing protein n=1 Tax=Zea mays TaxID=4577 RepID=A0A804QRU7_MAIZE
PWTLAVRRVAALDKLEADLSKFDDGPFFLGQFSLADVAYITILERVQIYYSHLRNYDIAEGRPNLQEFIEEMNKIEAYAQTKNDPLFLLDLAKNHLKIA